MQFIQDGPDIPDLLLQAHEDGDVVFFCGAGISYPAGLPGFGDLVDDIYRLVGTSKNSVEQSAYETKSFDATLGLLELRLPEGKKLVREALATRLAPKLRRKGATETHSSLLGLATTRTGKLRLVTTNYDRIFEHLLAKVKPAPKRYAAPLLPIPKKSRWDGLVYLHGLLPKSPEEDDLNRLILTSGDFGLAYLTERWAARFVSELFRNYVVCFVGYSIDDPVLRYMMDAMAADRMFGEVTPRAYAFGWYEADGANKTERDWKAKGVTPILYEAPAGTKNHSKLHDTLSQWANIYRDGITGKESIIVDHAISRPAASTREDNFVGRVLWALSEPSGLPAKLFADFDPVPSLSWLDSFSDRIYTHEHLPIFSVKPNDASDQKLSFSLVSRPSPYTLAPWMQLVTHGPSYTDWDPVMVQLARWLLRHLDDPNLILWLSDRGGRVHPRFKLLINDRINELGKYQRDDETSQLERIRRSAPNAIPRESMLTLWRLVLADRVRIGRLDMGLYGWFETFTLEGLTPTSRLELRNLLSPQITLKRPFHLPDDMLQSDSTEHNEEEESNDGENRGAESTVDWELVLASDHADSALAQFEGSAEWVSALPKLIGDFESLLLDALELLHALGSADYFSDGTHWRMPSISPHPQNKRFMHWTLLIELTRDAWLQLKQSKPPDAAIIASRWFEIPFPTFKRLALFAAANTESISAETWTSWLEADESFWLWSVETMRELYRLLVSRGSTLDANAQAKLENLILEGPPRSIYRKNISDEEYQNSAKRNIWLTLAKLCTSGVELGEQAQATLMAISEENPDWSLAENESDEFSHWTSGSGDPDFEASIEVNTAPRKRTQLVEWLRDTKEPDHLFVRDNWRETVETRFGHTALALKDLAEQDIWPIGRWRVALQTWSEESRVARSWRLMAPTIAAIPEGPFVELMHSLARWLEKGSEFFYAYKDEYIGLVERFIAHTYEQREDVGEDPVGRAINDPLGMVTQGLLSYWFRDGPSDEDGVPSHVLPLLNQICDTSVESRRTGRTILASRLISLFRIDRAWSEQKLTTLFNWQTNSIEAKSSWEGFLWGPRIYQPLLVSIKSEFLETANHYYELGDHAQQYATFLTYCALHELEGYSPADFQAALATFPQEGLVHAAHALSQAMESAGENSIQYWDHRLAPFWQVVWPKDVENVSPNLSEALASLCINAKQRFPEAVDTLLPWLRPVDYPDYTVHRLHEAEFASTFPKKALQFLGKIIEDQHFAPRELQNCLDIIAESEPVLAHDPVFVRLMNYYRQNRME